MCAGLKLPLVVGNSPAISVPAFALSVRVIQVGLRPCAIVLAKLIQCHAELGLVLALALHTTSNA